VEGSVTKRRVEAGTSETVEDPVPTLEMRKNRGSGDYRVKNDGVDEKEEYYHCGSWAGPTRANHPGPAVTRPAVEHCSSPGYFVLCVPATFSRSARAPRTLDRCLCAVKNGNISPLGAARSPEPIVTSGSAHGAEAVRRAACVNPHTSRTTPRFSSGTFPLRVLAASNPWLPVYATCETSP
jgi:hypothetical protein